jgi:zinc transport system substrate-binding protein
MMQLFARLAIGLFLLAPGVLQASEQTRLKVLTSILPVYSFAATVAGDLADVENLLPSSVGPHDYQFTPGDVRKVSQADLVLINGLGIETWLDRLLAANLKRGRATVVEVAAGLKGQLIESAHHHDHGAHEPHAHAHAPNPHVWLDPTLAAHCVTNVLRALQSADPRNAEAYARNAASYIEQLHALDREIQEGLKGVKNRPFVTHHDAFPYLVRRYGLRQIAVVEEVPDMEPSARELRQLMNTIRRNKVQVIFTEPQSSSRLIRQISRDLKLKLAELDPLETGEIQPNAYLDGMRSNLRALQTHLK